MRFSTSRQWSSSRWASTAMPWSDAARPVRTFQGAEDAPARNSPGALTPPSAPRPYSTPPVPRVVEDEVARQRGGQRPPLLRDIEDDRRQHGRGRLPRRVRHEQHVRLPLRLLRRARLSAEVRVARRRRTPTLPSRACSSPARGRGAGAPRASLSAGGVAPLAHRWRRTPSRITGVRSSPREERAVGVSQLQRRHQQVSLPDAEVDGVPGVPGGLPHPLLPLRVRNQSRVVVQPLDPRLLPRSRSRAPCPRARRSRPRKASAQSRRRRGCRSASTPRRS